MVVPSDERTERAQRRVGRVLAEKWRLDSLIGLGGMAAVYAATHTNNLREAAIKILHREFSANEDIRKRFWREGYIANKIGHPGVVAILDDGVEEDGSVFLVMELFHGETLHARAKASGGRLPPSEVLRIMEDLLDVLIAAHEAQVIHRDLKPENVFLTNQGEVKILDFGIARLLDTRASGDMTTQAGAIVGTPTYMPPEQIAGKMELIDGRTDLWAVGAMMFTLLSGQLVHDAKPGNAFLLAAMTAHARKLADVIPDVSPAIAKVVDRALAYDQADRYPDARAMQAAVREARDTGAPRAGAPKSLHMVRIETPSTPWSMRALVAGLLVGLVAAAAFFSGAMRRAMDSASIGTGAFAGTSIGAGDDDASAPDGGDGADGADASATDAAAHDLAEAGNDAGDEEDAGDDDAGDDDAGYEDDDAGDDEDEDAGEDEEEEDVADAATPAPVRTGPRVVKAPAAHPQKAPVKKPPVKRSPTRPKRPHKKRRPHR